MRSERQVRGAQAANENLLTSCQLISFRGSDVDLDNAVVLDSDVLSIQSCPRDVNMPIQSNPWNARTASDLCPV